MPDRAAPQSPPGPAGCGLVSSVLRRSAEAAERFAWLVSRLVPYCSLRGQPPGLLPGSACCRGAAVSAGGGANGVMGTGDATTATLGYIANETTAPLGYIANEFGVNSIRPGLD